MSKRTVLLLVHTKNSNDINSLVGAAGAPRNLLILKGIFFSTISIGYNHHFSPKQKRILNEKNLTNPNFECSDQFNSDNLSDSLYSDSNSNSDACSDNLSDVLYSVVTVYSVVIACSNDYSSNRGSSLYSVVIRESCVLSSE